MATKRDDAGRFTGRQTFPYTGPGWPGVRQDGLRSLSITGTTFVGRDAPELRGTLNSPAGGARGDVRHAGVTGLKAVRARNPKMST